METEIKKMWNIRIVPSEHKLVERAAKKSKTTAADIYRAGAIEVAERILNDQ